MLTLRFMAENVEKPKHAGAKENLIRAKIFWPKIFRKPEAVQDILFNFSTFRRQHSTIKSFKLSEF